ncbi:putative sugar transporter [Exophiala viscosa]|nr:putative sugar transporter [Exophiala viscosa]
MGVKEIFTQSTLAKYGKAISATPREVIFNHNLILSAALYAMAGIPLCWDQGSTSTIPSLPGFQHFFGLTSSAKEIKNFVSLVYIGCGVGAGLSFFINDKIGRLWSLRLYMAIWILGQLIATAAPNLACLYASRIISGFGIGPLTVIGPVALAEIAPTEIRGLITAWFTIVLLMALFVAAFTVFGAYTNMAATRLQYQVVWFSPCIFLCFCIAGSFFVCESPRWLFLRRRHDEGIKMLTKLRGLPADHPRVAIEIRDIEESISHEMADFEPGPGGHKPFARLTGLLRETFLVPANLRRVQQAMVSYALAQLSGANAVTSYFIPILKIIGIASSKNASHSLFLSCMYSMAKFFFTVIASFFFIDALGRRKSLFVGIIIQMCSDIYIGVYIKYNQAGHVSNAASQAAIAAIFLHGFGYAVGLLILPYVFGGEIWPNRIRSFGAAITQCFHWLFYYGVSAGFPSILSSMDNWGAFLFFAGWCFIALIYVFLMVPEISGLSVEEIDDLFKGPWFNAYRRSKTPTIIASSDCEDSIVEQSM